MKTYKSFSELAQVQINDDIFDRFIQMDPTERNNFFKEKGIAWGGEYLGVYIAKKDKVRIRTLTNPFNEKTLECSLVNRRKYPDKTRLVVKLITVKTHGQKQTPDNIFGAELVGLVDTEPDQQRRVGANYESLEHENIKLHITINGLKDENNKLKRDIECLKKNLNNESVDALKRQNEELRSEAWVYRRQIDELEKAVDKQDDTVARLNRRIDVSKIEHQRKLDELRYKFETELSDYENRIERVKRIASILVKRKINLLLHVTRIENLETILARGIQPANQLNEEALVNDKSRYDGKPDCTSLSVGRINYYYFRALKDKQREINFVCLYIDPVILLDDNVKYYCHHNAATYSIARATREGQLTTSEDLERMFADRVYYTKAFEGEKFADRGKDFEDDWPTSIQAEILYKGVIQPEFIKGVGFKSEDALEAEELLLKQYNIKGEICSELKYL